MTGAILKDVTIGNCRLILGNALALMPGLGPVDHIISDPPYEQSLHDAKNSLKRRIRNDGGVDLRGLDFAGIGTGAVGREPMPVQINGKDFAAATFHAESADAGGSAP